MVDDSKIDDIYDIATAILDIKDEYEEEINSVVGNDDRVSLKDSDPLKELIKDEDEVKIIVETRDEFSSINVQRVEGGVEIELNKDVVVADIPDDCIVKDVDASLNNGVLEVAIPRGD